MSAVYTSKQIRQAFHVTDRQLFWWRSRGQLVNVTQGRYTSDESAVLAIARALARFRSNAAFRFASLIYWQWAETSERYAAVAENEVAFSHDAGPVIEFGSRCRGPVQVIDIPEIVAKAERALLLTMDRRKAA